jgi:hypothetical protein
MSDTAVEDDRHRIFRHNNGSKMMDDSVDNSALIAFLMEATGASIEGVMTALENCGGNDQQALELLTGGGANQNAPSVHSSTKKGAKSTKSPRSLVDEDAEMVAFKAPLRSEQGESKPPNTGKKSCEFFCCHHLHHFDTTSCYNHFSIYCKRQGLSESKHAPGNDNTTASNFVVANGGSSSLWSHGCFCCLTTRMCSNASTS